MKLKVVLDEGAKMPTKAHELDAGFDLYLPKLPFERYAIPSGHSLTVDTGVHIAIPKGYVGMIKSKSGLNVKDGIVCEGVIDAGYTGSIVVKAYNNSLIHKTFSAGEKITQLVILPIPEVELEQVDSLEETERGNNGFGSSGR